MSAPQDTAIANIEEAIRRLRTALGGNVSYAEPPLQDALASLRAAAPAPHSDAAFQRLWTKYAALPQYDKAEWTAAFNEIWGALPRLEAPQ